MMGLPRWSKKFSDRFSRFDTIPAVTDTQPPSHAASHVAVASTLDAKASSLKNEIEIAASLSQLQLQCSVSAVAEQLQCEVLLRTEEVVFLKSIAWDKSRIIFILPTETAVMIMSKQRSRPDNITPKRATRAKLTPIVLHGHSDINTTRVLRAIPKGNPNLFIYLKHTLARVSGGRIKT